MWCGLMINPGLIGGGDHINYICGNDEEAKVKVKKILNDFGWKDKSILDLGDITGARTTEALVPLWVRIRGVLNSGAFNFRIIK